MDTNRLKIKRCKQYFIWIKTKRAGLAKIVLDKKKPHALSQEKKVIIK